LAYECLVKISVTVVITFSGILNDDLNNSLKKMNLWFLTGNF